MDGRDFEYLRTGTFSYTVPPQYADMLAMFDAEIAEVRCKFIASLEEYGAWEGYSLMKKFEIISSEYMEAAAARDCGDIHGEHGVINELRQTAAMCIKTIITEGK